MQKGKMVAEEALQIAEKGRNTKGKGEKERYTHLNAEFQRIAKRDKKAFLRRRKWQATPVFLPGESQGRGAWWAAIYGVAQSRIRLKRLSSSSSRDLFKKIRDTKGIFHAKMSTIKDRNGMDLTETEDIKKGWQEYTELYKKRSS